MNMELDGPYTTGTYEIDTPPRGREPVGSKGVLAHQTGQDGLIVKTKARLVAIGLPR